MDITQSYFSRFFQKVNEVKEKTILTMLNDNEVDLNNIKEDMESKGYELTHERWSSGNEIIRLVDKNGICIDVYKIVTNFSKEGLRVEVIKA